MIPVLLLAAGMLDTYLSDIAEDHWRQRKAAIAALKTPEQIQGRQEYVRQTMLRSLGGWPEKTPLNPRITGTLQRDGYRVEKLIYESLPGFRVTANLYIPAGSGPFPAVLGTAGHSNEGKAAEIYQRGWIGLVKRGFVVLAYDPPGQGERSEYWDAAQGKSSIGIGTREHTMAGLQCLLTGTNIARYEIWDGIRGFDYLLTRSEVDGKRVAVAGNSGGGTQSAYLSALEPRLAAAAPSCYITSWETLWHQPGPQDAEQNFHGFISSGLDFSDFLTAWAPRPVSMMVAIQDFFPIAGARATYRETADLFEVLRARDKVGYFEYDDKHGWSQPRREATYRWFEKWLNGRDTDGAETQASVEKPEDLNVTPSGQLATSGGSETVASLNRKLAARMYPKRAAAHGANVATLVRNRLGVSIPTAAVRVREKTAGRVVLETEPGITVEALIGNGAVTKMVLDPQASQAPQGTVVLLVRGWGASAPPPDKRSGYSESYQTFMRAYLLGRTMAGMQVTDILRALDYFRAQGLSINTIEGRGSGEPLALYTAVLDPAIKQVVTAGTVKSFLEITEMPVHANILDQIVPGVLHDFDLPDLVQALGPRHAKQ